MAGDRERLLESAEDLQKHAAARHCLGQRGQLARPLQRLERFHKERIGLGISVAFERQPVRQCSLGLRAQDDVALVGFPGQKALDQPACIFWPALRRDRCGERHRRRPTRCAPILLVQFDCLPQAHLRGLSVAAAP
jgi:hypothetical protein